MEYKDIFEAMRAHDIEAVKTFLPEHANDINNYGFTALMYTICCAKNKQIFDLLLDNGATPYAGTDRYPILGYLWTYNWTDKIQTLVDHEIDLNSPHLRIVSDICRSLGSPDCDSIRFNRDLPFLKELIRCGARTDIPDAGGNLPLDYLPKKIRKNIEAYMANIESERRSNIASEIDNETGFAYDI